MCSIHIPTRPSLCLSILHCVEFYFLISLHFVSVCRSHSSTINPPWPIDKSVTGGIPERTPPPNKSRHWSFNPRPQLMLSSRLPSRVQTKIDLDSMCSHLSNYSLDQQQSLHQVIYHPVREWASQPLFLRYKHHDANDIESRRP